MEIDTEPPTVVGDTESPSVVRVREKKINVPTQYRNGAKFLKSYLEEGKSISNAIENNHCKISSMYSLLSKIRANQNILDQVLEKTKIFENEPRLNPWMGKFLIGELLFGRGQLSGNSKPVECVLSYEDKLRDALTLADGEISTEKFEYKVPRYIRINTLKIKRSEVHEYLQNEGWYLVPKGVEEKYDEFLEKIRKLEDDQYLIDFNIEDILIFPSSSRRVWAHNELVRDWQFILQDKASCLPPFLLNPPKGSQVLDMCAAPGMKTTFLAALMKNKGKVYAIERDPIRYKELCTIVDMADARNVEPINEDAFKIDNVRCPNIEYILLDPSCSGSGMLSRDGKEQFDKDRVYKLAGLQYKLLKHAMVAFPNVKRIVYSTCSRYPEENEDVVHGIIRTTANFKLLNASDLMDNKWNSKGSDLFPEIGPRCLYARTKDDMTCTFFVAVFERCQEGEINEFYQPNRFSGQRQDNNNYDNYQEENQFQEQPDKRSKQTKRTISEHVESNFNEMNVEDEVVEAPKKFKKTKNSDSEHVEDEVVEAPKKSKKHKSSKSEHVEDRLNEINVEDESEAPKKSKKSKKKDQTENEVEDVPAEISSKKSKKHNHSEDNIINDENEDQSHKKSKKAKKAREEQTALDNDTESTDKKVKKSKKKRLSEEGEPILDDEVDQQPKKAKKSKKNRSLEPEEDENAAEQQKEIAVESEEISKPKKSKKSKSSSKE